MVTTHVFIAVSLDGYIARQDGDIDWLLKRDDPTEDHGYAAFIADKDWIIMGRGSYEKVLTFEEWPYDRPVLVLSRQLTNTPVPEALKGKTEEDAMVAYLQGLGTGVRKAQAAAQASASGSK